MIRFCPTLMLTSLPLILAAGCSQAAAPLPNFNNLPAYLRALKESHDPAAKAIRQEIADGPAALARERVLCAKAGLPTHLTQLNQSVPPPENAAPLYVQWDKFRKAKPLHLPRFAGSTWPVSSHLAYTSAQDAEMRALFAAGLDYTDLLDQATDRPRCVFVTQWTKYPNTGNFIYMGALREGARTYEARSYLMAKQGGFADAVTMQAHGFVIARHAADSNPSDVGFLVASAIDHITTDGMQGILQMAGPNAAVDKQVQTVLAAVPPFSFRESVRGEGAFADGTMALLRRVSPAKFAGAFAEGALPGSGGSAAARFTPSEQQTVNALCDGAEACTLAQIRGLFEATALPPAARNAEFMRLIAEAKDTGGNPVRLLSAAVSPLASLADIFSLSGKDIGDQIDAVPARHVVLAAGAAALAAKAQDGTFPETLPAGFADPYTGKPLGYRREGADGFVVYSVSSTGDFDGGTPGVWPAMKQIMFRYPAPPPRPLPAEALK